MKKNFFVGFVSAILITGCIAYILGNLNEEVASEEISNEDAISSVEDIFMREFSINKNDYDVIYFEEIPDLFTDLYTLDEDVYYRKFNDVYFNDDKSSPTLILLNKDKSQLLLIYVSSKGKIVKSSFVILENSFESTTVSHDFDQRELWNE